jgi:hypothetical protein
MQTGEPVLSVDFCLVGGDEATLQSLAAVVGSARWSVRYDADYIKWQSAFDHLFLPPMRGYWKSRYSARLSKQDIESLVDAYAHSPITRAAILIEHLHGAFSETGLDHAAFPLRWASFGVLLSARWPNPAQDDSAIGWVRASFARLDPQGTSAAYSNYTVADDSRALATFNNTSASRLAEVKRCYDPANLFTRNHNFRTTGD